jgi:hypothetical protein
MSASKKLVPKQTSSKPKNTVGTKVDLKLLLHNKSDWMGSASLIEWYQKSSKPVDVNWLEKTHDYVQVILPTTRKSEINLNVDPLPVSVNGREIDEIFYEGSKGRRSVRVNILCGAALMMRFFGMILNLDNYINPVELVIQKNSPIIYENNEDASSNEFKLTIHEGWSQYDPRVINVARHSHNDLRMTRLVQCLREFGFLSLSFRILSKLNSLLMFVGRTKNIVEYEHMTFKPPIANTFLAQELSKLLQCVTNKDGVTENKRLFSLERDLADLEVEDLQLVKNIVVRCDQMD